MTSIKNGANNKSSWCRRLQSLFCSSNKDWRCYYIAFWLILLVSLLVWTRTNNFIAMDSSSTTIVNTNINSNTNTAVVTTTTKEPKVYKQEVVTTVTRKKSGFRFVLNQTAEDIRIKKQYAALDSIPLCRRYQIISGQWLSVQYEKPPYVTSVQHLRCYETEYYHKSPYSTYTWMPDLAATGACDFAEYDTTEFCNLVPRATISIIGDSLSWEQYRSLIQLHHVKTRQGYQHQSYELNMNVQQSICDNGITNIIYRRDDYLQYVQESINENFPTILILNRGAHYVPDDQLKKEMKSVFKIVQKWLHKCEKEYKIECHFFWRTTVPGHIGCNTTDYMNRTKTPAYDLHDMEKSWIKNKSLYNDISREYHWYDFQHQNEIVLTMLKEMGLLEQLNVQVIDAYYINVLRPDEHRILSGDCLHSCYPGKMDVYNRLLLHYLKMQRSVNDIQRLQKVANDNNWPINIETEYDEESTKRAREIRLVKEAAALQHLSTNNNNNNNKNNNNNEESNTKEIEEEEDGNTDREKSTSRSSGDISASSSSSKKSKSRKDSHKKKEDEDDEKKSSMENEESTEGVTDANEQNDTDGRDDTDDQDSKVKNQDSTGGDKDDTAVADNEDETIDNHRGGSNDEDVTATSATSDNNDNDEEDDEGEDEEDDDTDDDDDDDDEEGGDEDDDNKEEEEQEEDEEEEEEGE